MADLIPPLCPIDPLVDDCFELASGRLSEKCTTFSLKQFFDFNWSSRLTDNRISKISELWRCHFLYSSEFSPANCGNFCLPRKRKELGCFIFVFNLRSISNYLVVILKHSNVLLSCQLLQNFAVSKNYSPTFNLSF